MSQRLTKMDNSPPCVHECTVLACCLRSMDYLTSVGSLAGAFLRRAIATAGRGWCPHGPVSNEKRSEIELLLMSSVEPFVAMI